MHLLFLLCFKPHYIFQYMYYALLSCLYVFWNIVFQWHTYYNILSLSVHCVNASVKTRCVLVYIYLYTIVIRTVDVGWSDMRPSHTCRNTSIVTSLVQHIRKTSLTRHFNDAKNVINANPLQFHFPLAQSKIFLSTLFIWKIVSAI